MFHLNGHTYTDDEIIETAERHGADGIAFYPPSVWGSDRQPGIYRQYTGNDETYRLAYIRGRERWRGMFGAYPPSGCDFWDVKKEAV